MKIAALSDIHGNLFALDAVLADIERRGADLIVNLGDILSGPLLPRETADRLMALQLPTLRGNHERQVLSMDPADMGASDRYAFDTITEAQRDWIAALPPVLCLAQDVFLCHATPQMTSIATSRILSAASFGPQRRSEYRSGRVAARHR